MKNVSCIIVVKQNIMHWKKIFKSKGKNLSSNVLTVKNGTFERYLAFFGKLPIENKQSNNNNITEENKRRSNAFSG